MVPLSGSDSQTPGSLPPQLPPDRTDSRQRVIQLGAESPAHGGSFGAGAAQTGSDIRPRPCAVLAGAVRRRSCARHRYKHTPKEPS